MVNTFIGFGDSPLTQYISICIVTVCDIVEKTPTMALLLPHYCTSFFFKYCFVLLQYTTTENELLQKNLIVDQSWQCRHSNTNTVNIYTDTYTCALKRYTVAKKNPSKRESAVSSFTWSFAKWNDILYSLVYHVLTHST